MCWKQKKIGKYKDLRDSDKGQIDDWVRAFQKLQLLWEVLGLQWPRPTKNGPRKENWGCGERRLVPVVRSNRRATVADIS